MTAQRPLSTPRARERREQLLAVSAAFWAARDYDDVSIDEIAAEAGVSHGLVFQHFGSKKNLYLAHLEQLIGEFRRRTTAAPSAEPAEALTAGIPPSPAWAPPHP